MIFRQDPDSIKTGIKIPKGFSDWVLVEKGKL